MNLPELLHTILPYFVLPNKPSTSILWHLAGGQGTCSIRYDDLCRSAHVSTSTLKRALKVLAQQKNSSPLPSKPKPPPVSSSKNAYSPQRPTHPRPHLAHTLRLLYPGRPQPLSVINAPSPPACCCSRWNGETGKRDKWVRKG